MVRFRLYTCKIVLVTSLVWLMIGVLMLMYYTDCDGNGSLCGKKTLVVKDSLSGGYDFAKAPNAPKGKFTSWSKPGM